MEKSPKKPSRGRPKLPAGEVRDRSLEIRLNAAEEKALIKAAGDNVSTWAREILLRAARRS